MKVLDLEKGVQPGTCKKTVQENDALLNEKRESDMLELLEVCKTMLETVADFTYDYTADENDKVENIGWSCGDSVHASNVFGDVVTFDTTYGSISNGKLLGIFVGATTCYHSVTLHISSYVMVSFTQTFFTELDSGLRDVIAGEMPNSRHIISMWHVLSKVPKFKAEFDSLCNLESIEDFEHQWNHVVMNFGLGSDKKFSTLFLLSVLGSVLYSELLFALNGHSGVFKATGFISVNVAAILGSQTREELSYAHAKACMPIVEHPRSILTPFAFNGLQHEILLSMQYAASEMANGSYLVRHYKKMDGECLAIWIPEDEQIHCSCKEFAHSGILCRHSL
ncbi:Zinc finger, SWIM-type [Dillenia turbinata]|uniref:Protein FAR1-RELATED SEQUENCE n=1 Tax=Dillenia turbinata TaxID=194707 RepID=A0AAN8UT82_9MAGN